MSIKPDSWITRMALEHKMIEPFVEHQVRDGVISFGALVVRLRHPRGRRVQGLHEHQQHRGRPQELRSEVVRGPQNRHVHHPAELVRPGAHGGVLPHPARRPDRVPRQVDLRALRDHRERDAVRAGVGRARRRSRSRTRRRCRRRSTPTRASRRSCSSRATRSAPRRIATRRGSTRRRSRSPCRGSRAGGLAGRVGQVGIDRIYHRAVSISFGYNLVKRIDLTVRPNDAVISRTCSAARPRSFPPSVSGSFASSPWSGCGPADDMTPRPA